MKKFLSSISLAALALCLTVQASHAMPEDESKDQNRKRPREGVPTASQAKRLSASRESPFDHMPHDVNLFIVDVLFPGPSRWSLRGVSHYWKDITDQKTTYIDLSATTEKSFVSVEERRFPANDALITNVHGDTFAFFNRQLCLIKSKEGILQRYPCKPHIPLIPYAPKLIDFRDESVGGHICSTIDPYSFSEDELKAKNFVVGLHTNGDFIVVKNPLIQNIYSKFSVDFSAFPNLCYLNLEGNTAIDDTNLKFCSNLKGLSLWEFRGLITDESLQELKTLEYLNILGNNVISSTSVTNLTNLTALDMYDAPNITVDALSNLKNLQVLQVGIGNNRGTLKNYAPCLRLPSLQKFYWVGTEHDILLRLSWVIQEVLEQLQTLDATRTLDEIEFVRVFRSECENLLFPYIGADLTTLTNEQWDDFYNMLDTKEEKLMKCIQIKEKATRGDKTLKQPYLSVTFPHEDTFFGLSIQE